MADTTFVPTKEEIHKISEAFKNDEFKKLFVDYVKEINDPESKRKYEQDITAMENERGVNVTFLNPTPGYVLKSSVDGSKKCFINICQNENVGKPQSTPALNNNIKGLNWSIPHTLTPPRDDYDKSRKRCLVYDVLFHPDTYMLASKNESMKKLVEAVALESVEKNFNVTVDKVNIKYPKINYKGMPKASVLRSKMESFRERSEEEMEWDKQLNYPPLKTNDPAKEPEVVQNINISNDVNDKYTVPKYTIKYRNHVDLQNYVNTNVNEPIDKIPSEIEISIHLPLLKSSETVNLDVNEYKVGLICERPTKYKLDLTLTYPVDKEKGSAKFDQDKRKLLINLIVNKSNVLKVINLGRNVQKCDGASASSIPKDIENKALCDTEDNVKQCQEVATNSESLKTPNDTKPVCYLDPSIKYQVPEYSFSIFGSRGCFTLKVANIVEKSLRHLTSPQSLWAQFTSLGSGHYPVQYSFYAEFPSVVLIESECIFHLNADVLNITFEKLNEDKFISCLIGCGASDAVETSLLLENKLLGMVQDLETSVNNKLTNGYDVKVTNNEGSCNVQVSFDVKNEDNKERHSSGESMISCEPSSPSMRKPKVRSFSESGEGLVHPSLSHLRGILKYKRSFSESSDDMNYWSQQDLNFSLDSDIPEESEGEGKTKKTVRFNDKIHRQLFRSNSSIVGQKLKNQRKTQKKKRAAMRRASESEASEGEVQSDDISDTTGTNMRQSLDERTKVYEKSGDSENPCDSSDKAMSDPGFVPQQSSQKKKNRKKRNKNSQVNKNLVDGANPSNPVPENRNSSKPGMYKLTNNLAFSLEE